MTIINLELKKDNIVLMQLKDGPVIIELLPDLAPKHVERFKELVDKGFYDNLTFHRVIPDFMAQTGDPTGTGKGGSGVVMDAEITKAHHLRGMVSVANKLNLHSDDSQFFILFKNALWLDNKHTIFARVVNGMEHVDKINNGGSQSGNPPLFYGKPDKILSMKLLSNNESEDFNMIVEDTGPSYEEYMSDNISYSPSTMDYICSWFSLNNYLHG
ncbi:MAG: peptidylprolyl isomerase [Sphingobacteriia bacterium]|nr:peptidylprolyl isomerase [Sphingobacteriia bacterium]